MEHNRKSIRHNVHCKNHDCQSDIITDSRVLAFLWHASTHKGNQSWRSRGNARWHSSGVCCGTNVPPGQQRLLQVPQFTWASRWGPSERKPNVTMPWTRTKKTVALWKGLRAGLQYDIRAYNIVAASVLSFIWQLGNLPQRIYDIEASSLRDTVPGQITDAWWIICTTCIRFSVARLCAPTFVYNVGQLSCA